MSFMTALFIESSMKSHDDVPNCAPYRQTAKLVYVFRNQSEIRKKINYKVVERPQFNMK